MDADGKRFGDELERIGYAGERRLGEELPSAYFEAHIEQGPILEAENKTIGVVTEAQIIFTAELNGKIRGAAIIRAIKPIGFTASGGANLHDFHVDAA